MKGTSKSARARVSRRTFTAGLGAAGFVAGTAPFNIVRAQGGPLKIAVMLPRSGYLAQAGQSCYRGALVAPKVLSDYGYNVELVHIDCESNADVSRTQAERAINEGCQAVVGAFEVDCRMRRPRRAHCSASHASRRSSTPTRREPRSARASRAHRCS